MLIDFMCVIVVQLSKNRYTTIEKHAEQGLAGGKIRIAENCCQSKNGGSVVIFAHFFNKFYIFSPKNENFIAVSRFGIRK
jgi:hypothetical protein